jgi:hypothetical protein
MSNLQKAKALTKGKRQDYARAVSRILLKLNGFQKAHNIYFIKCAENIRVMGAQQFL